MTLPPFPAHLARPLMNPVTADFLAKVNRLAPAELPAGDLIELARMVRNGDMVHVDAIPAWLEAQRAAQMRDGFVDACRTADAVWDGNYGHGAL
jgi:hypothetical protein